MLSKNYHCGGVISRYIAQLEVVSGRAVSLHANYFSNVRKYRDF